MLTRVSVDDFVVVLDVGIGVAREREESAARARRRRVKVKAEAFRVGRVGVHGLVDARARTTLGRVGHNRLARVLDLLLLTLGKLVFFTIKLVYF